MKNAKNDPKSLIILFLSEDRRDLTCEDSLKVSSLQTGLEVEIDRRQGSSNDIVNSGGGGRGFSR